ncbi:MAG: prephenate dehydrogenase/arogenate dehydrogenase family protein [Opitutales bacterium]
MQKNKKISILGMGLLGACLASSVRKYLPEYFISAWSRSQSSRDTTASLNIVDEVCENYLDSARGADFVFICTNVSTIAFYAKEVLPVLNKGAIVSDVGSIKGLICEEVEPAYKDKDVHFIASHPMAGSEKTGAENYIEDLFRDKPCLVMNNQDEAATKLLVEFWQKLGMNVSTVNPKEHDIIVSKISHLPHILASAMCEFVIDDKSAQDAISTGFKDTTRIASGDPYLWQDIISSNKTAIRDSIDAFIDNMKEFKEKLDDNEYLYTFLKNSKDFRDSIIKK